MQWKEKFLFGLLSCNSLEKLTSGGDLDWSSKCVGAAGALERYAVPLSTSAATRSRRLCQVHISLYSSFFKVKVKKQLLRGLLFFIHVYTQLHLWTTRRTRKISI